MSDGHAALYASGLEVRPHERAVFANGVELPLTPGEYEIVEAMAQHPGWVFSAEQLSTDSDSFEHSPESVSVLVSRLRQKLASAGVTDAIDTVRGFGYRLQPSRGGQGDEGSVCSTAKGLRDASWELQEAVFQVERTGTPEQQEEATLALEQARRAIYGSLAE